KITYDIDSVAYAAHSDGLKQMLTVRENLEFWSSVFGTGNIDEAVEAFFLGPLLTRMAGALSAGQKRRLGLARLLVTGRPIWVLDEPTVSLDVEAVARFGETIKTHLQSGGSALIATHIDLGIPADILDVTPFKAKRPSLPQLDGAFQ
ncbi:MAG: heme ABC exporter ATP-binding protein CcmA, partial [Paracoccaceae bacterium]|nr:heme ABC exporter ATP-binding protein CcmA [Paracoccaceae bacterium]